VALPASKSEWPPASETGRYGRMAVNSTWYGGDPAALGSLYEPSKQGETFRHGLRYALSRVQAWFWGSTDPAQPDDKVHLPVPQDIATLSSEVLFGEEVAWEVQPDPTWVPDAEGNYSQAQQALIEQTQARLDWLLDRMDFGSTLLAAAETASPLGSVALRIGWDKTAGLTHPVISRVDADHVVAEYEWGILRAVTFWHVVQAEHEQWTYHLERHEPGRILHGLYRGTRGNLGLQIPLTEHPSTAPYAALVDADGAIGLDGIEDLLATSVPNMLPDALDRGNESGRPDFTPGVLTLFDSIDRTMTSLMRDIADGRSRIVVADYMLDSRGAGKGVEFDTDRHIYSTLQMEPGEKGDAPITQVQFKIRVDEHLKALDTFIRKAIEACGYNVDADTGEQGADAMTATEYSGRAKKTARTRDKKLRYWRRVERLIETLLRVDAKFFASGITPLPVRMIVPDMMQPTLLELANTAKALREAKAASTQIIVELVHPDWTDDMVGKEVARILDEEGAADPATLGMPGDPGEPGEALPDEPEPVEPPDPAEA
jgi:hypothetical protein